MWLCKFKTKCKFFKKDICATLAVDGEETKALKIKMENLEKENNDLRITIKELEESFEIRLKALTNDKESKVDALNQKVRILEKTLQVQTTRLDKEVISELNADKP